LTVLKLVIFPPIRSIQLANIKLQKGKVPSAEMAENEHRFTLQELRSMWLVADTEGTARMSTAS
jgi:hypothetical protein